MNRGSTESEYRDMEDGETNYGLGVTRKEGQRPENLRRNLRLGPSEREGKKL